jgi:hypothetical protein
MPNKADRFLSFAFILFLGAMAVLNFFTPEQVFSQRENRYLARLPKLKLNSLISGNFSRAFEEYIVDQFALRDQWVLLKSDLERLRLKNDNNGIFFGRDGYLMENFQGPGTGLNRNIENIKDFALSFPEVPVYVLLAPSSAALYPEKLPLFARVYDQRLVLAQAAEGLGEGIHFVPIFDTLARQRQDYLYFRTDHHWTTLGAYYAYTELAGALGLDPLPASEFERLTVAEEFWGTYFSRANNRYLESDYIEALLPMRPVSVQIYFSDREEIYTSMYFPGHLLTRDKYSFFLDGNHPLTTIVTNADSDRNLMVFKDSFAHSLIPFLAQHYRKIQIVDLRFYNANLRQLFGEDQIDQALFLYGLSGFAHDDTLTNFR